MFTWWSLLPLLMERRSSLAASSAAASGSSVPAEQAAPPSMSSSKRGPRSFNLRTRLPQGSLSGPRNTGRFEMSSTAFAMRSTTAAPAAPLPPIRSAPPPAGIFCGEFPPPAWREENAEREECLQITEGESPPDQEASEARKT